MMKRVLIVDNDEASLDMMTELFTYEGFGVKTLLATHDVFKEIDGYKPHIILLDYILDEVNGGEICHQIKTTDGTAKIPVIIISAYSRVIESLGNYGCDMFIPKPFDISDLISKVRNLIHE